ncbi:MAG: response regulator transcription factor [Nitrospira sp.]|nr:response regulator transcription factor [Nitrospira sp.]
MTIGKQASGIKVLIVSSNTFLRVGLHRTFDAHPGIEVVGETHAGPSAHDLVQKTRPDLIVIDLDQDMKRVDIVTIFRQSVPHARVVVLAGWGDMELGRQALELGADVIMMKCQPASILLAILESMGRHHTTPPSVTPALALSAATSEKPPNGKVVPVPGPKTDSLTDRERAVVALVGQGLSNRDIGERLCISETTVRHHLTSIFDKLGVSNRQKLLLFAHQCGLTEITASA